MEDSIKTPYELFYIECGRGWEKLYQPIIDKIEELNKTRTEDDKIVITQIKEKWGTLRFYVNNAPQEIYDMISKAEERSQVVCEDCGYENPEKVRTAFIGGWARTICDRCRQNLKNKIK